MATRGKSINLFLMDGTPNGRTKCTLANWTGIAYKIPHENVKIKMHIFYNSKVHNISFFKDKFGMPTVHQ